MYDDLMEAQLELIPLILAINSAMSLLTSVSLIFLASDSEVKEEI